jgi:DNA-binding Lrp family transcriptional regulator
MKTKDKIVRLLKKHGQITIHQLSELLKTSRQYIHRMITELEELNLIQKWGKAPHVYYSLAEKTGVNLNTVVPYQKELFLNAHFILIDALGNKLEGLKAMNYWCDKQQLEIIKTIDEYIHTRTKYLGYFSENGMIDGKTKLINTAGIKEIGIDELYYLDFYAIERFGKTRLGTLMHYAKQGQNKLLMKQIVEEIKQRIYNLIDQEKVDAVVFVPPTIDRKIQIMSVLQSLLAIQKPILKVGKIKTPIIIPQKALSKIFERIANAKNTFIVPLQKKYNHVLIIDDAVGSGATINEIALKIKSQKIAKKITGLSITGSFKGFDVISEL